jgi:hypothetical protein
MTKRKKTVGQMSQERQFEQSETKVWPYVEVLAQDEFIPNLIKCVERGIEMFPDRDFYVSNAGKNEQLLANVIRSYWIPLNACPTPNYDQIVFKYNHQTGDLVEVWSIPTKDGCDYLIRNKKYIVSAEQDILAYTQAFLDGSLDKMAKFLNEEKEDAPSLILTQSH